MGGKGSHVHTTRQAADGRKLSSSSVLAATTTAAAHTAVHARWTAPPASARGAAPATSLCNQRGRTRVGAGVVGQPLSRLASDSSIANHTSNININSDNNKISSTDTTRKKRHSLTSSAAPSSQSTLVMGATRVPTSARRAETTNAVAGHRCEGDVPTRSTTAAAARKATPDARQARAATPVSSSARRLSLPRTADIENHNYNHTHVHTLTGGIRAATPKRAATPNRLQRTTSTLPRSPIDHAIPANRSALTRTASSTSTAHRQSANPTISTRMLHPNSLPLSARSSGALSARRSGLAQPTRLSSSAVNGEDHEVATMTAVTKDDNGDCTNAVGHADAGDATKRADGQCGTAEDGPHLSSGGVHTQSALSASATGSAGGGVKPHHTTPSTPRSHVRARAASPLAAAHSLTRLLSQSSQTRSMLACRRASPARSTTTSVRGPTATRARPRISYTAKDDAVVMQGATTTMVFCETASARHGTPSERSARTSVGGRKGVVLPVRSELIAVSPSELE